MPAPFEYQNNLFSALDQPRVEKKKPHFIYLLGTDCTFTERPQAIKEGGYQRGETLSYLAQLTSLLRNEKAEVLPITKDAYDYSYAYRSDSVDVVNGMDSLARWGGDRMAKALLLSLTAIANGATDLSVTGFSRGAVSSILLSVELERVKQLLLADQNAPTDKQRSLRDILADTSTVLANYTLRNRSYTKEAIEALLPDSKNTASDDATRKANLLKQLEKINMSLFVIDPVPGGTVAKGTVRIGWYDDFYNLPAFVTNKKEILMQHERSNAFKPVAPKEMPLEVLPGHHGMADGFLANHKGYRIQEQEKFRDTEVGAVQDMALYRWIDMNFPQSEETPELNRLNAALGHEELNKVVMPYLQADSHMRTVLKFQKYEEIRKNYEAFAWFGETTYLGAYGPTREVHYKSYDNITPITQLNSYDEKKQFVNLHHAQVWMQMEFDTESVLEKSIPEQLTWIVKQLDGAFGKKEGEPESPRARKIRGLVNDEKSHMLFREAMSSCKAPIFNPI